VINQVVAKCHLATWYFYTCGYLAAWLLTTCHSHVAKCILFFIFIFLKKKEKKKEKGKIGTFSNF
jgi:hypothetical protein